MYRPKPNADCDVPEPGMRLNVLVLNASLKHSQELSNTEELATQVLKNMEKYSEINSEVVRLADQNIPVGLGFRESPDDQWPDIVKKIKTANIIIFATPIWWGGRSSLMQRIIERFDSLDEEYIATGRSSLYNKVAGIVITGNEDGALSVMGTIMMVGTWLGFTFPPECTAYWVGEVGNPISGDRERRRMNEATKHMAANCARNLVYYAQLLKKHPLTLKNN